MDQKADRANAGKAESGGHLDPISDAIERKRQRAFDLRAGGLTWKQALKQAGYASDSASALIIRWARSKGLDVRALSALHNPKLANPHSLGASRARSAERFRKTGEDDMGNYDIRDRAFAEEGMSVEARGHAAPALVVWCVGCGAHETLHKPVMPGIDLARRIFRNKGWAQRGRKWSCPQCERPRPVNIIPANVIEANIEVAMDYKTIFAVGSLIETNFDAPQGVWRNGYSDERVAKETGVAAAQVAKMREEAFGKLKTPPELLALQNDVLAIRDMLAQVDARLTAALREFGR